ncbi:unnamed protein product [Phyllotreta striolata]|uniref:Protein sleepless n=1 Tax=Phyllotreta striolata TaxID=444603 RepID=A0A9N9XLR5_PHYSR|nr:unnamed protein product [Phyllotreta striolata]
MRAVYSMSVCAPFVFLALIHFGSALQCWKCHSEFDITCHDYFNVTRIEQNKRYYDNFNYGSNRPVQNQRNEPHLEHCDQSYATHFNQKTVCLKRVYRAPGSNDRPHVQRECRLVSINLKEGECPEDLASDRSRTVDFCGTCTYDGCNGATGIRTNVLAALILPVLMLLVLRK